MNLIPYAKRLVKANPERFGIRESQVLPALQSNPNLIDICDLKRDIRCALWHEEMAWYFVGPLLDEFKVKTLNAYFPYTITQETCLEAAFAAVCEMVEKR